MAKVTGIGGVFFLSRGDGKTLRSWYEKHLGMQMEDYGAPRTMTATGLAPVSQPS